MAHALRYLKSHSNFDISVVMLSDGVMTAELSTGVRAATFDRRKPTSSLLVRSMRAMRRIPAVAEMRRKADAARCRKIVGHWPPDIVFCNSASAADVLDAMGPFECPVLLYLLELENILRILTWPDGSAVELMKRHVTRFLSGSEAVKQNLMRNHGVAAEKISVVHDFIDTGEFATRVGGPQRSSGDAFERLGIPIEREHHRRRRHDGMAQGHRSVRAFIAANSSDRCPG